jgi:hypothetical protein
MFDKYITSNKIKTLSTLLYQQRKKQSDANYQSDKLIILLYENAFFQATREG